MLSSRACRPSTPSAASRCLSSCLTTFWLPTAPAPSWLSRPTIPATGSLPRSSACPSSRSLRAPPRATWTRKLSPMLLPARWSTLASWTACLSRMPRTRCTPGWKRTARATSRSTSSCVTGSSAASVTGASLSPWSTATSAAGCPCLRASCPCVCPRSRTLSRARTAKARWPATPSGSTPPAPAAVPPPSARPTLCPSGPVPAGISCVTAIPTTTMLSPARRPWSTGAPWIGTTAAWSTPPCTCCTPGSGTSSCMTSAWCPPRSPMPSAPATA